MKKNFAAYYRPTEAEIKEAAKTAIFVFDTNALLDFYRINPEIADKALAVIDRNKDRVYITGTLTKNTIVTITKYQSRWQT